MSHNKENRLALPIMVFILLLGWAMFVFHLETRSAWYDEPATYDALEQGFPEVIRWTAQDVHPPLYYLLVLLWEKLLATRHLTIMRISSIFPALLTVAICYRLGRDWFGNFWVGISASAFLATSGLFIHYATDLRMYALIMCLTALNWWGFWRLVEGRGGGLAIHSITLASLAYTHYFSVFAIVPQGLVILIYYRESFKQILSSALLTLLIFAPWLPTAISQISVAQNQGGSTDVVGKTLGTEATTTKSILYLLMRYSAGKIAFIALLIFLSVTLIRQFTPSQRRSYFLAGLWLSLPLVLFFGMNLSIRVYALRYTLPIFSAFALLVGTAILRFQSIQARMSFLLLLISINGLSVSDGFVTFPTDTPHRPLIQYVDERFREGDLMWDHMATGALGSSRYGLDIHLGYETKNITLDDFVWDAPHDFESIEDRPRVWYVHSYWVNPPTIAENPLKEKRFITDNLLYDGYIVSLYEAPPVQNPAQIGDLFEVRSSGSTLHEFHPGESIQVNTWWNVDRQLDRDYSVVVILRAQDDVILGQQDNALAAYPSITEQDIAQLTSAWRPGISYYVPITIDLPENLSGGDYDVWIGVYYWSDPQLIEIPDSGDLVKTSDTAVIRITSLRTTR